MARSSMRAECAEARPNSDKCSRWGSEASSCERLQGNVSECDGAIQCEMVRFKKGSKQCGAPDGAARRVAARGGTQV